MLPLYCQSLRERTAIKEPGRMMIKGASLSIPRHPVWVCKRNRERKQGLSHSSLYFRQDLQVLEAIFWRHIFYSLTAVPWRTSWVQKCFWRPNGICLDAFCQCIINEPEPAEEAERFRERGQRECTTKKQRHPGFNWENFGIFFWSETTGKWEMQLHPQRNVSNGLVAACSPCFSVINGSWTADGTNGDFWWGGYNKRCLGIVSL